MALRAWLKDTFARQMPLFGALVEAPPATPVMPLQAPPAAAPSISLSDALSPAKFAHPNANRRIALSGHEVHYILKRGKRRTIGLQVGPDGLSVSAPRWTGVREIESVILEKSAWVLKKLTEARDKTAKRDAQKIDWADGSSLPYLGSPIRLVLDAAHTWDRNQRGLPQLVVHAEPNLTPELHLSLPKTASETQIRDAAQAWLMRQATRVFTERLQHFAPQLAVRYSKLRLSSADTRWGSATSDGTIRLNWRLIHLPMRSIDYVVVHELSHLREMNHSPEFWGVVGSVLPDYAERRKTLKTEASPSWD
jgi:predicted metal-dependent hydrolase